MRHLTADEAFELVELQDLLLDGRYMNKEDLARYNELTKNRKRVLHG